MIKDFNRFDDIEDFSLKCWNRTAYFLNLKQDLGDSVAMEYLMGFDDNPFDKMGISFIYNSIKNKGYDATKLSVLNEVKIDGDWYDLVVEYDLTHDMTLEEEEEV